MLNPPKNILILNDNLSEADELRRTLSQNGYNVFLDPQHDPQKTLDLVLMDLKAPDFKENSPLDLTRKVPSHTPLIITTDYDSIDMAVTAIRLGARDILKKPIHSDDLLSTVHRLLTLEQSNHLSPAFENDRGPFTVKSQKMQEVYEVVKRVAKTPANILITGESGSGKEMVARAIHDYGVNPELPFIPINCAAIPEELLESELFGHSRGSFTGADRQRRGLFEEAEGGTIFLDEIGDMSLPLQAKLLRVLQDKKVKPIGENTYKSMDFRVVSATHQDLSKSIKEGRFREDLFYRLNVVTISVPPLRERLEDLPELAKYFLNRFARRHNSISRSFTKEAMDHLLSRTWPGNIRELENQIERAVILSKSTEIDLASLMEPVALPSYGQILDGQSEDELLPLSEIEKQHIWYVLNKVGGRKEKAARLLKIDRTTLYRKLLSYKAPKTPSATPALSH